MADYPGAIWDANVQSTANDVPGDDTIANGADYNESSDEIVAIESDLRAAFTALGEGNMEDAMVQLVGQIVALAGSTGLLRFIDGSYTGTSESGSLTYPHKTIQGAIDDIANAAATSGTEDHRLLVIIGGESFDEDPDIPQTDAGVWSLLSLIPTAIGSPGTPRNITRIADPAEAFPSGKVPTLNMAGVGPGEILCFGAIVLSDVGAGLQQNITIENTTFVGLGATHCIDATGMTAAVSMYMDKSTAFSSLNGTTIKLLRFQDCSCGDDLTVEFVINTHNSTIGGDTFTTGFCQFRSCSIQGDFTGSSGSFDADVSTYARFRYTFGGTLLGGATLSLGDDHADMHKHGGEMEVATATPAANAIPKGDGSGNIDTGWIADDSISNAQLEEMPANSMKARLGSSPNNPDDLVIGNGQLPLRPAGANLKSGTGAEAAVIIGTRVNDVEASLPTLAVGQTGYATDKHRMWVGTSVGNRLISGDVSCSACAVAAQNTNNGWNTIALDGEDFDTDAMHDLVTNNSRIVIPFDGKYQVHGRVTFSASATGIRGISIVKNGGTFYSLFFGALTIENGVEADMLLDLVATDYLEVWGYQTSGGVLPLTMAPGKNCLQVSMIGAVL